MMMKCWCNVVYSGGLHCIILFFPIQYKLAPIEQQEQEQEQHARV